MKTNITLLSIVIMLFLYNSKLPSNKEVTKIDSEPYNLNIENKESKLNNIILNIKSNYNVNIKIKEKTNIKYPDFTADTEENDTTINNALTKIIKILNKYNKEFFNNFYQGNYQGLNIYLTSTLKPIDYATQISNPAAYSLIYNQEYMIVIDINQSNIEELICHELMHNIEFNLANNNISAFTNWSLFNPTDFYYNNSYTDASVFNYTLEEKNINTIYFVDTYSHTYPAEDRARIFENICTYNTTIKEYPYLYNKALYLKEEILKNYPTLKYTTLFDILN